MRFEENVGTYALDANRSPVHAGEMKEFHSEPPLRRYWILSLLLIVATGAMPAITARAAPAAPGATPEAEDTSSPWLLVPTLSSNPKLGTSLGGMAAYMYYFDPESRPSLFGGSAQYTSTDSIIASVFVKTSFDADHQRLSALIVGGNIKNNYDDFLGTGQPLKSEDNLQAFAMRYQYRVWGDWFVGAQFVNSNYEILGATMLDQEILQTLGLTPLKAGGIGLIANLDSRDNEYSPHRGWLININNIAYRDWIAGKENYDVYRADVRYYWEHGDGHVLAVHQGNVWTFDAPVERVCADHAARLQVWGISGEIHVLVGSRGASAPRSTMDGHPVCRNRLSLRRRSQMFG